MKKLSEDLSKKEEGEVCETRDRIQEISEGLSECPEITAPWIVDVFKRLRLARKGGGQGLKLMRQGQKEFPGME